MANFSEVSNFVGKYLKQDGKSVEAITSYIKVDAKKIEKEQMNILTFLANNIYFMHEDGCPLINLTKDLEENTWNNVTTLIEYEVFEQLVAICFEVGLLEDDFNMRIKLVSILGSDGDKYLCDKPDNYEEFLNVIVNKVLPNYSFRFNSSMLAGFMPPIDLCQDDIKFFLKHWFNYYSHEPFSYANFEYFGTILETRLKEVLDFAIYQYSRSEGSTLIVRLCKEKMLDSFLTDYQELITDYYSKLSKEDKCAYDELMISEKNCFFNQLSLTFKEKYQKEGKKYE